MPDTGIPILDKINLPTVGRYAAGGAIGGAGVAAALNLVQMLREASEERKKKTDPMQTDEGTIVLTIPKKRAAAQDYSEKGVEGEDAGASKETKDKTEKMPKDAPKPKKESMQEQEVEEGKTKKGEDYSEMGVDALNDNQDDPAPTGNKKTQDRTEEHRKVKTKVKKTELVSRDFPIKQTSKQPRHYDGRYGTKCANWQTLAASVLAMGGGGAAGYALIDKLYELKRMKKKEQELNTAKSEYLDKLQLGGTKAASDPNTSTFGKLDYPLGMAALALLLGSGTTAFLTKRVLDEYNKEPEIKADPKVKRIVFKSAEDKTEDITDEKTAETVSAMLGIYMDICSGSPDVVGDEKCAEYLEKINLTPGDIYKMAAYQDDYYSLLSTLDQNPEFRKLLQRMSMEKHPILKYMKWSVGLPGIRDIADKKLYKAVESQFGPQTLNPQAIPSGAPKPQVPAGADKVAEDEKKAAVDSRTLKRLVEQFQRIRSLEEPNMPTNWFTRYLGNLSGSRAAQAQREFDSLRTFARNNNMKLPTGEYPSLVRQLGDKAYDLDSLRASTQGLTVGGGLLGLGGTGVTLAAKGISDAMGEKKAFLTTPSIKDIVSSYTGSTIAETAMKRKKKEEEEAAAEEDTSAADLLKQLEIAGADPNSTEFINNNSAKLKAILQLLAEQGKI